MVVAAFWKESLRVFRVSVDYCRSPRSVLAATTASLVKALQVQRQVCTISAELVFRCHL
jgi:hypothetical protein